MTPTTTTDTSSTSAADATAEYAISIAPAGSTPRVTALPPIGAVLGQGEPIVEIDGSPVAIVMLGDTTVTRVLGAGISDGADVRQLEQNLVELGYATAADLDVDDHWSDATTAAVIDWQHSLGVDETGLVGLGDVVFVAFEPTVIDHLADVGDRAIGAILVAATEDTRVTFEMTLADAGADAP
jgi:hypothetical protein